MPVPASGALVAVLNPPAAPRARYRIIPQGSFSKVTRIGDERTTYDLYFDNRIFGMRRLNQALKYLALCMQVRRELLLLAGQAAAGLAGPHQSLSRRPAPASPLRRSFVSTPRSTTRPFGCRTKYLTAKWRTSPSLSARRWRVPAPSSTC